MSQSTLLITGATGYIGGSVLTTLKTSSNSPVKGLSITALVRQQDQAEILKKNGTTPRIFGGLDDYHALKRAASEHDIVVHTASGFHTASALALIEGMRERKRVTGRTMHYIHTSGTWNLAESSLMSGLDEMQSLSDRDDDIVELEQKLEALDTFSQRTTDLAVLQAADEAGIRAYILMPPDVYGVGSGLFNTLSSQIPDLVRSAISHGAPAFVENGTGQVGHVHVRDLAALYGVLLGNILEGINVPSGWKGIYFCSTGTHSWKHVAHILGSIGENIGVFDGKHPISIGIEEATRRWTGGDIRDLKLGYCARLETRPDNAIGIGWRPTTNDSDWVAWIEKSFDIARSG